MKQTHYDLARFEAELSRRLDLPKTRFRRVDRSRWEEVYYRITETFVDKTRTWKKGLHWANTNGYSPWAMDHLLWSGPVDYAAWFSRLPQMLPHEEMVYFLIEVSWDRFWLFESGVPELVSVLELLTGTAFLELGWPDYYIVSKKYRWIMGFNHHDCLSCAGEGLRTEFLQKG